MKKYIAIVNPLSSGSELAPIFVKAGIGCLAICSKKKGQSRYSGFASSIEKCNFEKIFEIDECPEGILEEKLEKNLAQYGLLGVIPGVESAVNLADKLNSNLIP